MSIDSPATPCDGKKWEVNVQQCLYIPAGTNQSKEFVVRCFFYFFLRRQNDAKASTPTLHDASPRFMATSKDTEGEILH